MSFDFQVGGAAPVSKIDPVLPAASVKGSEHTHTEKIKHIYSTKELKRAEMQGEEVSVSDEQLIKAIEKAIKAIQGNNTSLEFAVHKETKQIMVKVLNKETGELIREVPPEKNLDFIANIWKIAGLFVDEKR